MSDPRRVVLLGSTGSIGTQALDVVDRFPEEFAVAGLAAGGSNIEVLADQVLTYRPEVVGVARATAVQDLQLALYAAAAERGYPNGDYGLPRIIAGPDAATEVAAWPCDVVLNGMTGSVGLRPTLAALASGATLALANKESLIAGGPLVKAAAAPGQVVPVDSEHSALAQCLLAGEAAQVRRLVLTASGGPFRDASLDELERVTPEQALDHPTWDMGPVVTINSATMVNKGLEVIEAHLLFDVPYEAIDVVVHPQSMVHSMVEFVDGSTLAQVSPPDMRLPIALGLNWPRHLPGIARPCDWTTSTSWDFHPLDPVRFPAVELAKSAGALGGTAPAVFNAANEVCVAEFLAGNISFSSIVRSVSAVLAAHVPGQGFVPGTSMTLADVATAEAWARDEARRILEEKQSR
ncbi:MAG: 1-deoxy-D-xylulose-5-phosphate reductoisomerase [Actinobacteria bacterium]|nr:1-deoxy-D-xylulose-5-phosphate reductoisomerase [Actinomycetota bacterium]MCB9412838.1 1-deoxy-D-xylulose-5-phosphate reductoisomerase [Actinomycetota bacterium]